MSPPTVRSMSGAGFEFEDLISAWLMVKMLNSEQAPFIGGAVTMVQAQVSALGWPIDDLLLTTQDSGGVTGRLAISVKGNLQVSASGLPEDFVNRAWELWSNPESPMNTSNDGLALVTQGTHPVFDPIWREIKNACSGSDVALTINRIRDNSNQSKVFESVHKLDPRGPEASDQETIELIRKLHVLPMDFQFPHSKEKTHAIRQCQQILASGELTDAESLWKELLNVASDVRIQCGTIKLQELWSELRKKYEFHHHPDYTRDWETLFNISSDYKARIESVLPSGYTVPRTEEESKLEAAISTNTFTVIFGESGTGKSALVKKVLDRKIEKASQVWFGPEELSMALSASGRGLLRLRHDLAQILNATPHLNNVLVIDSAERIDPANFSVIQQFLNTVLSPIGKDESVWRIIVITQTSGWGEGSEAMFIGRQTALVEISSLKNCEVKLALMESPPLGWISSHEDTVSALTNLKILAWLVKAGTAFGSNASRLTSHTSIADLLWDYWTEKRIDLKRLMMKLAQKEASFQRSFPLIDLDQGDDQALTPWPNTLPLHLNQRNNHIEFEHDLAADWARFQFLKQIWTDTEKWANLAENPLWINSLQMLGQYLLRQTMEHRTAWDVAFESSEETELTFARDILLDALCLDPEAERFLTERIDLLLANNAKLLTKLLLRFHHIGTVPTGGVAKASSLSLYLETQYRSVIIGRWFAVLRFLIGQREKLSDLISSALAKVIQTWLAGTPREFDDGTKVLFRRELTEMALSMARTIQVKKGHGVIFIECESLLYSAPLAGAEDLPDEVGTWALELAGRKIVDKEVISRITQIRQQKAEEHEERLKNDKEYKARHETKRKMSASMGSFREKLPPWPLGAQRKIDSDFQRSCLKDNGLLPLMRACPEVAAEVLLALIIEDQPEREYGSNRHEIELGLDYARDGYPTAFWKSPFFSFLSIAPVEALKALITLVNFCTERWIAEVMERSETPVPGLKLQTEDGEEKFFDGWWQVFGWTQSNSHSNGNLFCALDALERWLTIQLDADVDITLYVEQIIQEGKSAAFIGLLVNVGKFRPSLFSGVLRPLLTDPRVFYWDSGRVQNVETEFSTYSYSWCHDGEVIFNIARNWALAPHRQKALLCIIVELMKADAGLAVRLQTLIPNWTLPEDPKQVLEFQHLFAQLNRNNYRHIINSETDEKVLTFVCPDELLFDIQSWQDENGKPLQYLLLPDQCEKLLQAQHVIRDEDATCLYKLLEEFEIDKQADESSMEGCRLAVAATLIVLGNDWLAKEPEAKENVLTILKTAISEIASTAEEIRTNRRRLQVNLKFAAYAAIHLWMKNDEDAFEWEAEVLKLLTSGDSGATDTIIGIAYDYRQQLGSEWWRLLKAGLLWSGLIQLLPHYGDDKNSDRVWPIWLAKLRRFPLRGKDSGIDDLKVERIAVGCERLDFHRRLREFEAGGKTWRGKPERRIGMGLDTYYLGVMFNWLIKGPGTGEWAEDVKLVGQFWAHEVGCIKEREKEENGEYGLLSDYFGYDLLLKISELTLAAPEEYARNLWEPVLVHGPEAHYALQHFIIGLFQRLSKGDDPHKFERIWREIVEYVLAAKWEERRLWFHGERLICSLLGFGSEDALRKLTKGAAVRMLDAYECWAGFHLKRDEENVRRFCYFLTTEFGASLRLDGLRWIANMLKEKTPSRYWYRDGTGGALIELVNTSLNQNSKALSKDSTARQATLEITALLVSENISTAFALQDRIKLLR